MGIPDWIRRRSGDLAARLAIPPRDPWSDQESEPPPLPAVDLPDVEIVYRRVCRASCIHRPDGTALIYMPLGLTGAAHDQALAEELGHADCTVGMAAVLRGMTDDPRLLRLARFWEWSEERTARDFAACLLGRQSAPERSETWDEDTCGNGVRASGR